MIIHCKIYFVFFCFRGLSKPRKYFYNENFQIYGTPTNFNLGQLSDFHYIVLAMQYTSSKYVSFKSSKLVFWEQVAPNILLSAWPMTISTGADEAHHITKYGRNCRQLYYYLLDVQLLIMTTSVAGEDDTRQLYWNWNCA